MRFHIQLVTVLIAGFTLCSSHPLSADSIKITEIKDTRQTVKLGLESNHTAELEKRETISFQACAGQ